MKFPFTAQDIDDLIHHLRTLDAEDKLYLAGEMFGCEEEADNYGQIILHTGLTWDKDGMKVVKHIETDDELDL